MKIIFFSLLLIAMPSYCTVVTEADFHASAPEQDSGTIERRASGSVEAASRYFAELPTYDTQRLILRPLAMEDAEALAILFQNQVVEESEDTKMLERAQTWIAELLREKSQGKASPWVLQLKDSLTIIGFIGFDAVKLAEKRAKITRGFLDAFKGIENAYFEEAMAKLLWCGFEELKLNKIVFEVREGVKADARLKKLGFSYDGVKKDHVLNSSKDEEGQELLSMRIYTILSSDFFKSPSEAGSSMISLFGLLQRFCCCGGRRSPEYHHLLATYATDDGSGKPVNYTDDGSK